MEIIYFSYVPGQKYFEISINGVIKLFSFVEKDFECIQTCMDRTTRNVEIFLSKTIKLNGRPIGKPKKVCFLIYQIFNLIYSLFQISIKLEKKKKRPKEISKTKFLTLLSDVTNLNLILFMNDQQLKVNITLPSVKKITLSSPIIITGSVVLAMYQLSSKDYCDLIWYRGLTTDEEIVWEKIAQGKRYLPTIDDLNYNLKVVCTPKNQNGFGPSLECISKTPITAGPTGYCPFERRHVFTSSKLKGNQFRVISYNVLADCHAKKKNHFPYCPPNALNINYRRQLLIKEIIGYNSDIICLQEVDWKIFHFDLKPILKTIHMMGNYIGKETTSEGLVTFYDTRRFKLIEETKFIIGESIRHKKSFERIWTEICENTMLVDRLTELPTTLQVTALQSKDNSSKIIVVANTHLYYHPNADHIRLLQIGLFMICVKNFVQQIKKIMPGHQVDLIFCGDFNSFPENGVYKLMTEKIISNDFIDWKSCKFFFIYNLLLLNYCVFQALKKLLKMLA